MQTYSKQKHELGFYQVCPTPSVEELEHYYRDTYFQCPSITYATAYSNEERIYIDNRARVAEKIWFDYSNKKSGTIFDIGCGEGFFANYFLKKGWKATACDFSSFGVESFNKELLPYLIKGDVFNVLDEQILNNQKYDFINFANVLEHVIDPILSLNKIKQLMNKNSLLKINVPNDFSKFQELLLKNGCLDRETWFYPPDHLNYFTFETLENLLISLGFNIIKKQADFSIESYLTNEHSNYSKDEKVGPQAHLSRIMIDNFLVEQGIEKYINHMQSAAELGFSRSVIIYVSIK